MPATTFSFSSYLFLIFCVQRITIFRKRRNRLQTLAAILDLAPVPFPLSPFPFPLPLPLPLPPGQDTFTWNVSCPLINSVAGPSARTTSASCLSTLLSSSVSVSCANSSCNMDICFDILKIQVKATAMWSGYTELTNITPWRKVDFDLR